MTIYEHSTESYLADGRPVSLYFVSPSDAAGLDRLCLYLAALPRLSGYPPGTIPDPLDLAAGGLLEGARYLAAEVEGRIVGAVVLSRDAPAHRHGYHAAHVAEMELDLLPDWRGQGVGKVLIETLIAWAKTLPELKRLAFQTLSCNEWVIELLGQAGFAVEGRAQSSWRARTAGGEIYLDHVRMGLVLDEASPPPAFETAVREKEPAPAPEPLTARDWGIPEQEPTAPPEPAIEPGPVMEQPELEPPVTEGFDTPALSPEPDVETEPVIDEPEPEPEPAVAPDPTIPDVDCSRFFGELISQVRAFLPYELREFKAREKANELHLLIEGLEEGVFFAVAFRLASAEFDTPDMIEVGLHLRRDPDFNWNHVGQLKEKVGALGEALGGKTLHADVWREDWGRVALRLPYHPPNEAHAFMLAAQVAGFVQVLLPEAKALSG